MNRKDIMKQLSAKAKEYDRTGDVVMRRQASETWRELATASEAERAPKYITWAGKK